jgi:SAM-dependent methyltransferase
MTDDRVARHHEGQRAYFQSADQPTMLPTETPYSRRHFAMLGGTAGLRPGSRVLEIGAGMGRFTRLFDASGYEVVASDISAGQIAVLSRDLPHLEAFVADAAALPPPDRPYDAVVGFFALHHLPDLRRAFRGFADVLNPGGLVAFCEPNALYVPFYLQVLLTPRMRWSVEKGLINMRPSVMIPALAAAGFDNVSFTRYGYFPPFLHNPSLGRRLEAALEALPVPSAARAFQIVTARLGRS